MRTAVPRAGSALGGSSDAATEWIPLGRRVGRQHYVEGLRLRSYLKYLAPTT
ncbi:MAG: hypothetical protein N3G79_06350 [Sulfolobales archaeon]|nr:hypothetical protein [Sulfolobales archaeon]